MDESENSDWQQVLPSPTQRNVTTVNDFRSVGVLAYRMHHRKPARFFKEK